MTTPARLDALHEHRNPFRHWIADGFLAPARVAAINAAWPAAEDPGWRIEGSNWSKKAAMLFPQRLPAPAQALAAELFSADACRQLSDMIGLELQPDPWFLAGPDEPRLGGGLHEIHAGGLLKVHVDFEKHPSGLRRVANLLIYLNEAWQPSWGGALELHGKKVASIMPLGGRAVLFATTPESWHGHPWPLATPVGITRRSLALYYYADAGSGDRAKTVYRTKR